MLGEQSKFHIIFIKQSSEEKVAQWSSHHLEHLHLMSESLVQVLATLIPIQLPDNVYPGKQH